MRTLISGAKWTRQIRLFVRCVKGTFYFRASKSEPCWDRRRASQGVGSAGSAPPKRTLAQMLKKNKKCNQIVKS